MTNPNEFPTITPGTSIRPRLDTEDLNLIREAFIFYTANHPMKFGDIQNIIANKNSSYTNLLKRMLRRI